MEIAEIWRYPVKSMLGEPLDQAKVSPDGIQGDRQFIIPTRSSVETIAQTLQRHLSGRKSARGDFPTQSLGTMLCSRSIKLGFSASNNFDLICGWRMR